MGLALLSFVGALFWYLGQRLGGHCFIYLKLAKGLELILRETMFQVRDTDFYIEIDIQCICSISKRIYSIKFRGEGCTRVSLL